MSEIVDAAVAALNERLEGGGFDGSVKLVIEDGGAVLLDESGAAPADGGADADCTLTASAETFRSLLAGELDATAAFMNGALRVDGDMGVAMRLGAILA